MSKKVILNDFIHYEINEKNNKFAIFNSKGEKLTSYLFDSIEQIDNGYWIENKSHWAIIDEKGRFVIQLTKKLSDSELKKITAKLFCKT